MAQVAGTARPSALAGTFGEAIAEFFGTLVLILFGDGCVACFGLFRQSVPGTNTWDVIMFGWGFAVMLGIYVSGAISGAHLNPAVTLGLAVGRRFAWNKVIPYIIAQVLGAFIAAGLLYFVYGDVLYVVAIAHNHRAPNYWRRRLTKT